MQLPTQKKRDYRPKTRFDVSTPDPPDGSDWLAPAPPDATDPTMLFVCAGCMTSNVVDNDAELEETQCVRCGSPLRLKKGHAKRSRLVSLFDKLTGIRKRNRARLGFRRALAQFELEANPNFYLEGERLRDAIETWLLHNHAPWDRPIQPRKALWDDRPWLRFGLIAFGACALVASILFLRNVNDEGDDNLDAPVAFFAANALAQLEEAAPHEILLARPVAVRFFSAASIDELLPVIRDRERVEPLLRSHYAARSPQPIAYRTINFTDAAHFAGRTFLRLAAELPDGRFAGLTLEKADVRYLIDWESFVGYSEVDWTEFKRSAPNSGRVVMLRANATFIERYAAPFDNRERYQSLVLESQDGQFLTGYRLRDDAALINLRAKVGAAGKNRYEVIVRVRYPQENWRRDDVEIVEIVQTGWVIWDRRAASDSG